MNKKELLELLNLPDAFENFEPIPNTILDGWNGNSPLLSVVVNEVKPSCIIEIGSWLGQSAVNFSTTVKKLNLECPVICVDTWLGSVEHWIDPKIRPMLELQNGYPSFYKRFLTNCKNYQVDDVVVPIPMPSLIAANFLKEYKIKADIIYVDGSHDQNDVFNDLSAYWPMLNNGGILMGDDASWDAVFNAVQAFSAEIGHPMLQQGIFWMFRKTR
jgi:predicted O-methyltransferase YrrM